MSVNIIMVQPENIKSKVRGLEKVQKVGMMKEKGELESAEVIKNCQPKFQKPDIGEKPSLSPPARGPP